VNISRSAGLAVALALLGSILPTGASYGFEQRQEFEIPVLPVGWAPAVAVPSSVLAAAGPPAVGAQLATLVPVLPDVEPTTRPWGAPTGAPGLLMKGTAVLSSFYLGTLMGKASTVLFGADTQDMVCRNSEGVGQVAAALATGNECLSWNDTHPSYVPNQDQTPSRSSAQVCDNTFSPARCFQLLGSRSYVYQGSLGTVQCYSVQSTALNKADSGVYNYAAPDRWYSYTSALLAPVRSTGQSYQTACNGSGANYYRSGIPTEWSNPSFRFAVYASAGGGLVKVKPGTSPAAPIIVDYPDPERTFECQVTGSDGYVYTATSQPFWEASGTISDVVCPTLPEGVWATQIVYRELGGGTTSVLSSTTTSPAYQDWASDYPNCMAGACPLQLYKDGETCFTQGEGCDGWVQATDQSMYDCRYYIVSVPLSDCFIYGPYFNQANQESGHAYGDPATGALLNVQTSASYEDQITSALVSRRSVTTYGYAVAASPAERREWARVIARQCLALRSRLGMPQLFRDCKSVAIFSPGADVLEAADHDFEAIVGIADGSAHPEWVQLDYLTDLEKRTTSGFSREWYKTDTVRCGPYPSSPQACDEYPFWTSLQGGPTVPVPSLRMILGSDNSVEGLRNDGFAAVCGLKDAPIGSDERKYLVIPIPYGDRETGPWSTAWCAND